MEPEEAGQPDAAAEERREAAARTVEVSAEAARRQDYDAAEAGAGNAKTSTKERRSRR